MMWDEPGDAGTRGEDPPGLSHDGKQKDFKGAACGGIACNHDINSLATPRQDGMASLSCRGMEGTDGVCTQQSKGTAGSRSSV